jgi:hypothetical protein
MEQKKTKQKEQEAPSRTDTHFYIEHTASLTDQLTIILWTYYK